MKKLNVDVRPTPMDCLDLYKFCAVFLTQPNKHKPEPIEFNCLNGEFKYENFVPNKTIVNLFNEKLETFKTFCENTPRPDKQKILDKYGTDDFTVNELFSAYLRSMYKQNKRLRFNELFDSCIQFIKSYDDDAHKEYLEYQTKVKEYADTHMEIAERPYEYKTDEDARKDVNKHFKDGKNWRSQNVLRTLIEGHKLELSVEKALEARGYELGLFYGRHDQQKGESALGLEFKNDLKSRQTHNYYFEIGESRHGETNNQTPVAFGDMLDKDGNPVWDTTVKSGMTKDDHMDYMVYGPMESLMTVRREVIEKFVEDYGEKIEQLIKERLKVDKWSSSIDVPVKAPDSTEINMGVAFRVQHGEKGTFVASKGFLIKCEDVRKHFNVALGIDGLVQWLDEDRNKELEREPAEPMSYEELPFGNPNSGTSLDDDDDDTRIPFSMDDDEEYEGVSVFQDMIDKQGRQKGGDAR